MLPLLFFFFSSSSFSRQLPPSPPPPFSLPPLPAARGDARCSKLRPPAEAAGTGGGAKAAALPHHRADGAVGQHDQPPPNFVARPEMEVRPSPFVSPPPPSPSIAKNTSRRFVFFGVLAFLFFLCRYFCCFCCFRFFCCFCFTNQSSGLRETAPPLLRPTVAAAIGVAFFLLHPLLPPLIAALLVAIHQHND